MLTGGRAPEAGEPTFTKRRPDAPVGFFDWEAAGLAWLGAATASGGVPVVGVRDIGARHIVLDRVHQAAADRPAAEAMGRALACTHSAGAVSFGCGPPGWVGGGWIGRQELALQSMSRWGEFYAQLRVLPYAHAARRIGHLSDEAFAVIERVCGRLVDGDFDDDRPPARIHGDLWGGNVLYSPSGAVLIDPAAHGGHGLTDLAMLALFGTQHLDRVAAAYAEAARLPDGWPDLIGLHQLHPVLVHAVSHSASYGRQAAALARDYA